jgi:DNA-binding NarL/FixJ family response regulator
MIFNKREINSRKDYISKLTKNKKFKLALFGKCNLYLSGIHSIFNLSNEFNVICKTVDEKKIIKIINRSNPEVLIIDIIFFKDAGVKFLRKIKNLYSDLCILIIIDPDHSRSFSSLKKLSINGIFLNDTEPEKLLQTVKEICYGKHYFRCKSPKGHNQNSPIENNSTEKLSKRELEIIRLFYQGLSYEEISEQLNISKRTVETHKRNIHSKLKIHSTVEMIKYAMQNDIV